VTSVTGRQLEILCWRPHLAFQLGCPRRPHPTSSGQFDVPQVVIMVASHFTALMQQICISPFASPYLSLTRTQPLADAWMPYAGRCGLDVRSHSHSSDFLTLQDAPRELAFNGSSVDPSCIGGLWKQNAHPYQGGVGPAPSLPFRDWRLTKVRLAEPFKDLPEHPTFRLLPCEQFSHSDVTNISEISFPHHFPL
jgi:hypothetical protein